MLTSFFTGLSRASRHWRMILLLLAVNILISIPLAVPVFLLVAQTSSGHLAATAMLADKLDLNWATDLVNERLPGASPESFGGQIVGLLAVLGVSYLLLNTLFAGGILSVLAAEDGGFAMRAFWVGCGAYFWRFFRLMLISLLFYGAAYLVYFLIGKPVDAAARQAAEYGPIFYKRWASLALLALLFAFVNMVFDYAKISAVIGSGRRMFRETIAAWRFALRHFLRTYLLYWLIALIGLACFAGFAWLRGVVNQSSILAVLVAFLLAQMAMATRMWARVTFYAAEFDLYWRLRPMPTAEIEFAVADAGNPIFLLPADEGISEENQTREEPHALTAEAPPPVEQRPE